MHLTAQHHRRLLTLVLMLAVALLAGPAGHEALAASSAKGAPAHSSVAAERAAARRAAAKRTTVARRAAAAFARRAGVVTRVERKRMEACFVRAGAARGTKAQRARRQRTLRACLDRAVRRSKPAAGAPDPSSPSASETPGQDRPDGTASPAGKPTVAPAPILAPAPAGGPGAYTTAINTGSWGDHTAPANDMQSLGAKAVRVGLEIGTPTSTIDDHIAKYHAKGITVMLLAEFDGRIPSASEARGLAAWADRYGAGGSFWAGKANPRPVSWIEFGNETAYTYQFSDNAPATYAQRAKDYAQRVKDARIAMDAAGPAARTVGLLGQSDPNGSWADGMFAGVADLEAYVAGWTMHPYGPIPAARRKMDDAIASLAAHGAAPSAAKPMFITEYGIASDDGRTLDDNYGWPTNMTYAQAGAGYLAVEAMFRATYAERLRMLVVYSNRDLAEPGTSNGREKYFGSLKRNNWAESGGTDKGAVTDAIRAIMRHGA